ncbi:MAG: gamma carbonic anhydrase family protein [Spirochaetes bacterium]|nr:gamma carbonic anhydrase family protein [Spirochaetota bacterium]
MIYQYGEKKPDTGNAVFIAENASIIGDVSLGNKTSIWFGVVLRGDIELISVGEGSNIQDNVVVHVDYGVPAVIGDYVTIGHSAVIHACKIGSRCIIGMGAVVLSRAVIGDDCVVGAGSVVTENKIFPNASLIIGSPARVIRKLNKNELERIRQNAVHYIAFAEEFKKTNGN